MVWGLRALGLELFMRVSRGSEYKCDVSCRRMLLPFRPFSFTTKGWSTRCFCAYAKRPKASETPCERL